MSQLKRKILFPTAVYFKDIPDAKKLNKYLFKEIKKWRKADPEGERKQTLVLVGTVKLTWTREKNINHLLMNYLKWLTSVIKILVLQVNWDLVTCGLI